MRLNIQLKLLADAEQTEALLDTTRRFNAAASFAAQQGFARKVFGRVGLHHLCYADLREKFSLSSQMAVRAIARTADAFRVSKVVCPEFRSDGAVSYDERILTFRDDGTISILTVSGGRLVIPFVCGKHQAARLKHLHGQCDLLYRRGHWYLHGTARVPEEPLTNTTDFLGVDLGIASLTTDSEGEAFSGKPVERNRQRRTTARKQYQRRGTKNAKRKLKKMAGRQRRFQAHQNHIISKRVVAKAKALGVGIALEDLSLLRDRVEKTVSANFRRRLGNWGFFQLRTFIEYKAKLAGVVVELVDPRNSSRTCSRCGHCAKANRKSQAVFSCLHCQFSANADENAALNLRAWAASNSALKTAISASSTND